MVVNTRIVEYEAVNAQATNTTTETTDASASSVLGTNNTETTQTTEETQVSVDKEPAKEDADVTVIPARSARTGRSKASRKRLLAGLEAIKERLAELEVRAIAAERALAEARMKRLEAEAEDTAGSHLEEIEKDSVTQAEVGTRVTESLARHESEEANTHTGPGVERHSRSAASATEKHGNEPTCSVPGAGEPRDPRQARHESEEANTHTGPGVGRHPRSAASATEKHGKEPTCSVPGAGGEPRDPWLNRPGLGACTPKEEEPAAASRQDVTACLAEALRDMVKMKTTPPPRAPPPTVSVPPELSTFNRNDLKRYACFLEKEADDCGAHAPAEIAVTLTEDPPNRARKKTLVNELHRRVETLPPPRAPPRRVSNSGQRRAQAAQAQVARAKASAPPPNELRSPVSTPAGAERHGANSHRRGLVITPAGASCHVKSTSRRRRRRRHRTRRHKPQNPGKAPKMMTDRLQSPTQLLPKGNAPAERSWSRTAKGAWWRSRRAGERDCRGCKIVTTPAKRIMQDTWRYNTSWDEELPKELHERWGEWLRSLRATEHLRIPRCYDTGTVVKRTLHTFIDASEEANAAAVYWRLERVDGSIKIVLAAAKSRVTPLKPVSIPRLELQAALLGSRLAQTVANEHDYEVAARHYWSDSRTALAWIRAEPRAFKSFVAHRLAEIEEITKKNEWRWVPTAYNVADDATRATPTDFNATHRWFHGPEFLYQTEECWPREDNRTIVPVTGEEREVCYAATTTELRNHAHLPDVTRFSRWTRLIRTTARVLQFIERCRGRKHAQLIAATRSKQTASKEDKDPTWGQSKRGNKPTRSQSTARLAHHTQHIMWRFMPPSAPFMGGAWKRLVRAVKEALRVTPREQRPSEETLHTVIVECENVVNSRPLTHVSVDPADPEALTPNHILIGPNCHVPPPGTFDLKDTNARKQWRRAQLLADNFWRRWVREYLPTLQYRREARASGESPKIGDLVVITDGNLPRNSWPRGRITRTFPGEDGEVRVVEVTTSRGHVLRRPTKKVIVLPVLDREGDGGRMYTMATA